VRSRVSAARGVGLRSSCARPRFARHGAVEVDFNQGGRVMRLLAAVYIDGGYLTTLLKSLAKPSLGE